MYKFPGNAIFSFSLNVLSTVRKFQLVLCLELAIGGVSDISPGHSVGVVVFTADGLASLGRCALVYRRPWQVLGMKY